MARVEKEPIYENQEKNSVITIICGKGCKERSFGGRKQGRVKERKKKVDGLQPSLLAPETTQEIQHIQDQEKDRTSDKTPALVYHSMLCCNLMHHMPHSPYCRHSKRKPRYMSGIR